MCSVIDSTTLDARCAKIAARRAASLARAPLPGSPAPLNEQSDA